MKRIISLALVFCLVLSLSVMLTACPDNGGNVDNQVYEEFDPNKQYELDFLGWGSIAEQKNFQEMIAEFMKEYPNVKVFYNAISDTTAYSNNLVNNADNLPDVFYVPDWDYIKWVDSGRLLNLTPYLSEEEMDSLWDKSIDMFRWDDEKKTVGQGEDIYGLPKDLGPYAIAYNKTLILQLIEEYDLDVELPSTTQPMTFSEFKQYLGAFKGLEVDGVKIVPLTHYEASAAVYSNNANYYTDDSAKTSAINTDNFIDAIQFVADLSLEGLAADYASAATSSALTKFASQQCLFTWMGPWDMRTYWESLSFEFDIMPVPVGEAEGSKSTTLIGSVAYSVSAASENKAAAVLLAKWLATSDKAAEMNYKLGQAMPNVQSMAENEWLNNVGLSGVKTYPTSKSVFLDPVKGTATMEGKYRPYYYTYEKTAFDDLMDKLNPVWAGTKTAREAIEAFAEAYQQKLTKMHQNLD